MQGNKDITNDCEQFIKSLADISNRQFQPESVSETKPKDGISEVTIRIDGNTHQLKNKYVDRSEKSRVTRN